MFGVQRGEHLGIFGLFLDDVGEAHHCDLELVYVRLRAWGEEGRDHQADFEKSLSRDKPSICMVIGICMGGTPGDMPMHEDMHMHGDRHMHGDSDMRGDRDRGMKPGQSGLGEG